MDRLGRHTAQPAGSVGRPHRGGGISGTVGQGPSRCLGRLVADAFLRTASGTFPGTASRLSRTRRTFTHPHSWLTMGVNGLVAGFIPSNFLF